MTDITSSSLPKKYASVFHFHITLCHSRIHQSRMAAASRASLLPRHLTRNQTRRALKKGKLLPSEKLNIQQSKSASEIMDEKLENLFSKNDISDLAEQQVPDELKPPSWDPKPGENNKSTRVVRSTYHGYAPGFKRLYGPWEQSTFSLNLQRPNRRSCAMQM